MRVSPWIAGLCIGLLLAPFARAQSADQLFGPELEQTINASELPEGFKPYEVRVSGATSSIYETFLPFMGMTGGMGGGQERGFLLFQMTDVLWTKGETATIGGASFIKGFKLDLDLSQLASQGSNLKGPMDLKLKPVLIRADSIIMVSAKPNASKEKLMALVDGEGAPDSPEQVKAKQAETNSKMKQVALGLMMYANDYDDEFPYVQGTASMRAVVNPYTKNADVFKSDNPLGDGQILMNMALAGVNQTDIPAPSEAVMLYESAAWPDGSRLFAFADGHTRVAQPGEAEALFGRMRSEKFKRKAKPLPFGYMAAQDPLAAWLRERSSGASETIEMPKTAPAPPPPTGR